MTVVIEVDKPTTRLKRVLGGLFHKSGKNYVYFGDVPNRILDNVESLLTKSGRKYIIWVKCKNSMAGFRVHSSFGYETDEGLIQ